MIKALPWSPSKSWAGFTYIAQPAAWAGLLEESDRPDAPTSHMLLFISANIHAGLLTSLSKPPTYGESSVAMIDNVPD